MGAPHKAQAPRCCSSSCRTSPRSRRVEERGEDLACGPCRRCPLAEVELGHPALQSLGVFREPQSPPLTDPHGGLAAGTAPPAGAWSSSMAPCHSLHSRRSDKKNRGQQPPPVLSRTRLPVQQLPARQLTKRGALRRSQDSRICWAPRDFLCQPRAISPLRRGLSASRSWGTGGRTTWHTCRLKILRRRPAGSLQVSTW